MQGWDLLAAACMKTTIYAAQPSRLSHRYLKHVRRRDMTWTRLYVLYKLYRKPH